MPIEEFAQLRGSRMVSADSDPAVIAFLAEMSKSVTSEALTKVGRANQEADNRVGLAALDIPLYLLYAEYDEVIKRERTDVFIELLPRAKVIELEGVGHAPYVEDPEYYNRTIRTILADVWPGKETRSIT